MEFRGSSGYGLDWWRAGFRDWGGLPYDDVIDGTRWALAQGYADPSKVCIVGASYGGYLALIAATRNEDHLFRCATSISGVSDLVELRDDAHFFRHWELAVAGLQQDYRKLQADSPRNHAASVNVPLLLIHGDRDYTVVPDHTKAMDSALTHAGKPHQTVIVEGADHYYRSDTQRKKLLGTLGEFLEKELGPTGP